MSRYCSDCGCYIPIRFNFCPACRHVNVPRYSRSEEILRSMPHTEDAKPDEMVEGLKEYLYNSYGAELIVIKICERLGGSGKEIRAKLRLADGYEAGIGVCIPPSAVYSPERFEECVYDSIDREIKNLNSNIQRLQTDLGNCAAFIDRQIEQRR